MIDGKYQWICPLDWAGFWASLMITFCGYRMILIYTMRKEGAMPASKQSLSAVVQKDPPAVAHTIYLDAKRANP